MGSGRQEGERNPLRLPTRPSGPSADLLVDRTIRSVSQLPVASRIPRASGLTKLVLFSPLPPHSSSCPGRLLRHRLSAGHPFDLCFSLAPVGSLLDLVFTNLCIVPRLSASPTLDPPPAATQSYFRYPPPPSARSLSLSSYAAAATFFPCSCAPSFSRPPLWSRLLVLRSIAPLPSSQSQPQADRTLMRSARR